MFSHQEPDRDEPQTIAEMADEIRRYPMCGHGHGAEMRAPVAQIAWAVLPNSGPMWLFRIRQRIADWLFSGPAKEDE